MKSIYKSLINLALIALMLFAYWVAESFVITKLYATVPVIVVVGAIAFIAFIVGAIAKKPWVVITFPTVSFVTIIALAVMSIVLRGETLI